MVVLHNTSTGRAVGVNVNAYVPPVWILTYGGTWHQVILLVTDLVPDQVPGTGIDDWCQSKTA